MYDGPRTLETLHKKTWRIGPWLCETSEKFVGFYAPTRAEDDDFPRGPKPQPGC